MTRYSVHPRKEIFGEGCGFLFFAKNINKNIAKNISKNLSGRYSLKLLDHAKQSATDEKLKLLPREQFKKQQKELVI